jgi:transcription initiation factor IIF auxiliary subunit
MKVVLLHAETKSDVPADIFSSVTYNLHESFGEKAKQMLTTPPFRVAEDGWGEFELSIVLTDLSGKSNTIIHDLNFADSRYEVKHVIVFKNPKPPLLASLRGSGPIPGEPSSGGVVNGEKKRESGVGAGVEKKKKKGGDGKGVDMDKLAEGLQKLGEDDLLQVVQMVHDNKNEESWMRNDVERECNDLFDLCGEAMLMIECRGRVPRGSLHTTGQSHQDAVGLHQRTGGHHGGRLRRSAKKQRMRLARCARARTVINHDYERRRWKSQEPCTV